MTLKEVSCQTHLPATTTMLDSPHVSLDGPRPRGVAPTYYRPYAPPKDLRPYQRDWDPTVVHEIQLLSSGTDPITVQLWRPSQSKDFLYHFHLTIPVRPDKETRASLPSLSTEAHQELMHDIGRVQCFVGSEGVEVNYDDTPQFMLFPNGEMLLNEAIGPVTADIATGMWTQRAGLWFRLNRSEPPYYYEFIAPQGDRLHIDPIYGVTFDSLRADDISGPIEAMLLQETLPPTITQQIRWGINPYCRFEYPPRPIQRSLLRSG